MSRSLPQLPTLLRALGFAAVLGAILAAWSFGPPSSDEMLATLETAGPWKYPVFVLAFAAATVLALPAFFLTAVGAIAFGFTRALPLCLIGGWLGAAAAFGLSRGLGRHGVAEKLRTSPRLTAIDESIRTHGAVVVLLLRLLPVAPFNVLNYLLGLSAVSWKDYLGASFVGMIPGACVYTFAVCQLVDAVAAANPWSRPGTWVAALALFGFLVVLPLGFRRANRIHEGQLIHRLAARLSSESVPLTTARSASASSDGS